MQFVICNAQILWLAVVAQGSGNTHMAQATLACERASADADRALVPSHEAVGPLLTRKSVRTTYCGGSTLCWLICTDTI